MSYYSEAREYHERGKYEEAYKLYEQGANAGDEKCFYGIALFFHKGYFVEENKEKAAEIFAEHFDAILNLAESGDAEAMFIVSCYYSNGFYVEQNDSLFNKWLIGSAKAGYSNAQWRLGYRYKLGNGIEKNVKKAVKWHKKAAEQGNSEGQWRLGVMYEFGDGVKEDVKKAVEWYTKAAEQGNSDGQWRLGTMYQIGDGVKEDVKKAVEWYTKAAEQGNSDGQWRLGTMYEIGESVDKSDEKAVEWYKKAAEQGNSDGQWLLGTMYEVGKGVEKSYEKAVEWYKKAAEQGNSEAQWRLGNMYYDGLGTEKDYKEAANWYQKSADNGEAEGQWRLGVTYQFGNGVEHSYEKAVEWYTKAAKQDNADGQWRLGTMYHFGEGVEQSYEKAVEWYKKAAEQGNSDGQWRLGTMYEIGESVDKSDEKAVEWYKKAAEQGNAEGQWRLGTMYHFGEGVEKSYEKAVEWYTKAAKQDNADGQWLLGVMYQLGKGVEKSYEKAVEWYTKAAKQDNADGMARLGCLLRQGNGVTKDIDQAEKWFLKAIAEDEKKPDFPKYLGDLYLSDRKDYDKAFKWYQKAADLGNIGAVTNMGYMYESGKGVEENHSRAFELYKQAAELGSEVGMSNLGACYENGLGVTADPKEAIYWYEKAINSGAEESHYGAEKLAAMYLKGNGIEQNTQKALELLNSAYEKGNVQASNKLAWLCYNGKFVVQDYHKAFEYWSSILDDAEDGEHHFWLGQCYHNCRGVDYDITDESTKVERLTKAKEHYKKALEYEFNCRLPYEMVKRDLGERSKGGDTRTYVEELLNTTIDKSELLEKVEANLKNDFGEYWDKLKDNTKQALISGIFYYVMNISCGEEACNKIDFTNVVATLSKALEIELAEFFGKGYIEFLRDVKKLPAYKFDPEYNKFVLYPDRPYERKFVRDENAYIIKREAKVEYCDERNNYGFSLGSLYYLLNVRTMPVSDFSGVDSKMHRNVIDTKKGKSIRVIDPYMQEYARLLFRKDAFGEGDFDEMATNYLIDLAEDVRFIKDIRNPADHEIIVNRKNAEVLCDALVKTPDYKILCELLDKISPEYIQKSLEAQIKVMDNKSL